MAPNTRGKLISLATETARTLFFDFLPVDLGTISGFQVRIQLYTVPGQVFYNTTRKLVLKGVDGIVFVADSRRSEAPATLAYWNNMLKNLEANGLDYRTLPIVVQMNKRDLEDARGDGEYADLLRVVQPPIVPAARTSSRASA